jgi:hypothetical protein
MNLARLFIFINIALPTVAGATGFVLAKERPPIQSLAIKEASGLAVSPRDSRFLWAVNDSGGTADLHLFNTDGTECGRVKVSGANNIDWEDLASFTLDGKSWLLIADTGDNNAVRKSVSLHIIGEPKLPADGAKLAVTAAAEWRIDFTYEGGPRDCESVAVDLVREKIILVSKRTKPPEVYELPLRASKTSGPVVAVKVGELLTDSPAGNLIPFANQPVAMDISADGSLAAIATYYGVFLFPRQPAESWTEAFAKKPQPLAPHGLAQAESLALSKDGKTIFVVSEGRNSPVVRYQKSAP